MTATNHALTGAMVATVIKQPFLALPLAFISHFICDALPHFGIDFKFGSRAMYTWLTVDGLAALAAALFLVLLGVNQPVFLALAGFVAMSPDLAWLYYGINGKLGQPAQMDPVSRFHATIQWCSNVPGILVEFVWAVAMLAIILALQ